MKVILLKDVTKVGQKYDIKNVSDGYALNFLIPKKLAKIATDNVIKELEVVKAKHEGEVKIRKEELMKDMDKLNGLSVDVKAKMNEEGKLFAGIDKKMISTSIKDQKAIDIEEEMIILEKPIKKSGEYEVKVKVEDKIAKIKINIIPEE